MNRTIEVVPYDPNWPTLFETEAALLRQALGDNCLAIHHIGSTAVPGLSAKPVIDILPVVKDILDVDTTTTAMENLGYEAKGECGMAFRRYFQKGSDVRTHHVHVYEDGDSEISRHLKFRDWMRSHPDDACAYAKLKLELAEKFPNDIFRYCMGKDAFVTNIDAKDGFTGSRMVRALTDREWAAVHALRQQHVSDLPAKLIENKEHIHFVFYKNADIIGYAHLQLFPENKTSLQMLTIDKRYHGLGFEKQLLKRCQRWSSHQGMILGEYNASII